MESWAAGIMTDGWGAADLLEGPRLADEAQLPGGSRPRCLPLQLHGARQGRRQSQPWGRAPSTGRGRGRSDEGSLSQ